MFLHPKAKQLQIHCTPFEPKKKISFQGRRKLRKNQIEEIHRRTMWVRSKNSYHKVMKEKKRKKREKW